MKVNAAAGLKLRRFEQTAVGLRELEVWVVAEMRLSSSNSERAAARLCELAKAARLNLAGFDRAVAERLCELTMVAILCELAVVAVLSLAVLEWAAAKRHCKLAMARLDSDSWTRGWLVCETWWWRCTEVL